MIPFFSDNTIRLIQTYYDKGLDVADIMERLDLHDDFETEVERVIQEYIQDCDDTEQPFEPGDYGDEDYTFDGYYEA